MKYSRPQFELLWRWLRITGVLIGSGFIVWLLWRMTRDPQWLRDHVAIPGFIEAIVIGIAANAVIGIAFSDLVAKTAPDIAFPKRITAYYYAQIAKYVPGRLAALLVQRSILSGANATAATIMSNLELIAVSGWLCAGAALALLLSTKSILIGLIIGAAAIAIGALLIALDWNPIMQRILRWIPKYRMSSVGTLPSRGINRKRSTILSTGILVLPAASSYVLLINGLHVDQGLALLLTALLLLSWVGGVIAFVFPAGIGIRELIFFALGSAVSDAPAPELMAGIALASRLVQVLVDVAGTLLFLAFRRWIGFAKVST